MRKYLLLAGAALIGFSGSAYAALDCSPLPDCDYLGYRYKAEWCADQAILKCPFDQTKVFCIKPDNSVTCEVGSVLYNDLKCYDEEPFNGQTAIGVVFDTSNKLAIALDLKVDVPWGGYGTDISGLDNCRHSNYTTCGTDGQSNTQKIVSVLGNSSTYAAGFCGTTALESSDGKSVIDFFLPSASELTTLYNNKTKVNAGLKKAGGMTIRTRGTYWSSTECTSTGALVLPLGVGGTACYTKDSSYSSYYARCAVAY